MFTPCTAFRVDLVTGYFRLPKLVHVPKNVTSRMCSTSLCILVTLDIRLKRYIYRQQTTLGAASVRRKHLAEQTQIITNHHVSWVTVTRHQLKPYIKIYYQFAVRILLCWVPVNNIRYIPPFLFISVIHSPTKTSKSELLLIVVKLIVVNMNKYTFSGPQKKG